MNSAAQKGGVSHADIKLTALKIVRTKEGRIEVCAKSASIERVFVCNLQKSNPKSNKIVKEISAAIEQRNITKAEALAIRDGLLAEAFSRRARVA